ncbi:hypothetical protein BJ944DRAFT_274069 [Cunninghamella echinulata]|nr:hypothetical protein BJ944DRAFT_274069 [Cunninghamella echinulata]
MTYNITHVTGNPIVFSSAIIAAISWLILFIGICLSGFKGIIGWTSLYQLGVLANLFYILRQSTFTEYRLVVLMGLAIAIILTTQLIDNQLHHDSTGAKASAAGGIILTIMEFFWIIIFGSTQDSWIYGMIYGFTSATPMNLKYNDKEASMPLSIPSNYSMAPTTDSSAHSSMIQQPASLSQQLHPQQQQANNLQNQQMYSTLPLMNSENSAIALHPYTANPEDPNELSFHKDEVLEILDRQGNWWQARKQDGVIGIVPSNYFTS